MMHRFGPPLHAGHCEISLCLAFNRIEDAKQNLEDVEVTDVAQVNLDELEVLDKIWKNGWGQTGFDGAQNNWKNHLDFIR